MKPRSPNPRPFYSGLRSVQFIQGVAGETLTVTCWYLNKGGQYEAKVWCKANSDGCEYLIVISKPRTLVQDTQYMIWDDPDSGFLNITMNKLTEQDSGTYWCGIVNTSANSVTKIREISLEVSPGYGPRWAYTDIPTHTDNCFLCQ
uniref:Ig-like domain-containing protein n=1 Tax=Loxodonta africana TaxID=9785 RepID=G3U3Z2_LOXAF